MPLKKETKSMKVHFTFLRVPELETYLQIQFCLILRTDLLYVWVGEMIADSKTNHIKQRPVFYQISSYLEDIILHENNIKIENE